MRAVVIGGTGHIGSYLIPRLVRAGMDVVSITRRDSAPYTPNMRRCMTTITKKGVELRPLPYFSLDEAEYAEIWRNVQRIQLDRRQLESEGAFGKCIAEIKPDVVCDLICYDASQAEQMLRAGAGRDWQLITAGTVWVFDEKKYAPVDERHPRTGTGEYGQNKIAMEKCLLEAAEGGARAVTVVHPGHVVGRGWVPLGPQGNFNIDVFRAIAHGERIVLPEAGQRTLQHVHADDVAGLFMTCIEKPDRAAGEAFLAVCPAAITQAAFAEAMFAYFGREQNIVYEPDYERYLGMLGDKDRLQSDEHLSRSPDLTCEKSREILGYVPQYDVVSAVADSLDALKQMQYL